MPGSVHCALGKGVSDSSAAYRSGSGSVQEKERALLEEIITKMNDLFGSDTTEGDKLVYVNSVLKGKLLASDQRAQQASSNTKEQFANSPDLAHEILNAAMDAFAANSWLSRQALDSERVHTGLKEVLLGPAQVYEALREQNAESGWRKWVTERPDS